MKLRRALVVPLALVAGATTFSNFKRGVAGLLTFVVLSFTAFAQTDTTPPSVPTGLAASAITVSSFTLTWNASTDNVGVTGYEIFKGSVSLGTTGGLNFNVSGLSPNTAYSLRVRARDAAGKWSAQSTSLSVKTLADTTAPSVPTALAASAITATGFTFTWPVATDNIAVTGYEVFKGGVSLGTTTTLSKVITGLAPTTAYAVTVRARDAAGNWSAQSVPLTVTTLPDTSAPNVPAGLSASTLTATGFTLKWNAATDNVRVTAYEVFRDGVSLGVTTSLAKTITGLLPATAYVMTVRARDAAGNFSAVSPALSVTTSPDTTAPSVPVGLTSSTATISSFLFRWNAATDNVGVTGYEIFKDGVSLGQISAPTTSLSVTGLALSTTYSMTVRARDAAGNWSAQSAPRLVTTLADTTPPTVPTGLVASATTINSFTLSWSPSTDNVGVTAYEVFRGSVSLGTTTSLGIALSGLAPNTGYSMRVRARDAAGKWSAQSAALVVRTLPDTTAPAIPMGLAAGAVSVVAITLNWSASPDDVATTLYEVFRNGISVGTTAALTKTITGLTPDTEYAFTVRARDAAANWSEFSSAIAVSTRPDTTAPAIPSGLNASVVSVSSFTLKWAAATDDVRVTGYEVFRDGVSLGVSSAASRNITGLTPESTYAFTVRARDAAGNWSAVSVPMTVTTLPDTTPPAVPTGLVATSVTGAGFTLRWTAPKDNVRTALYEVFRDGVSLGTSATTSRVLTGLFPETEYAMTVRAADAAGNWSAQSLALPVTTLADTTAPSVPTALVTSAVTTTSLTLSWTASTDAVGVTLYEIFNGTVSLGVTTSALTANLAGLAANTTYSLRVRASDAAGNWSAPSAIKSVKTLADTIAPSVPSGLVATAITGTTLTLGWDPATDNVGVTAYEVFRGTVSQGITAAPTLNLTGLTLGTTYALKVRARDAAGNWSAQSSALSVTTYNDTTPPTVPDGLVATAVTLNALTLVWNASTDDVAVTAYEIFRNGVSLGTSATPAFNLTGLALNTVYTLTVRARDATGNWSALSAPLDVSPAPDTVPPTAPDGVAASRITPTGFTLNWTPATDEVGVTGYEVFVNGVSVGTTGATTFSLIALPPVAPPYRVTVRARDAAGNWSDASTPLSVTINLVPFFTGFEPADGYALGSLHGQNGWSVDGAAAVVASPVYRGAQAVAVAPFANLSLVTREFANTNPAVTFVDVFASPAGGTDPNIGTFFETDSAAVSLTASDGVSTLYFFDGNGTGGGDWLAVYPGPAVDSGGLVTDWHRISVRLDYAAKRWDLYFDGRIVAANLGFLDNTATSFTSLSLNGHAALTTSFDDVFVGFENPLFTDVDKDGMDDAWELANGLNPAVNDRAADLDGDGVSNLQEYLAGTGANIPNTPTDTDGDGLPDAWEYQYFGSLMYGPTSDPANSGRSLLQSYQQGLNPLASPFDSSGLRLWLRADVGVQADASGYVNTWSDLSGQHKDATQGYVGGRPLLVKNAVNGKPVIRFDGNGRYLDLPTFMNGSTEGELFVVLKLPNYDTREDEWWSLGGSDGTWVQFDGTKRIITEDFGRTYRTSVGSPIVPVTDYFLYNVASKTDDWRVRLNGLTQSAETTNTFQVGDTFYLGRGRGNFLQGDIAEVLIFDRVLSSTERTTVGAYLASKYAITLVTPPPAPTLTAAVSSATSVALSWTPEPVGQGSATIIERQVLDGEFTVIATVTSGSSYTDDDVAVGPTYKYRAKATNSAGSSDYSAVASVVLAPVENTDGVPVSGQRLWLRADVGVTADANGAVSVWRDQSGRRKDAVQANLSSRPQWVPNAVNGTAAIRFDGIGAFLNLPDFMEGAAAAELFVVVKVPGFATRYDGLWSLGGADGALTELRDGVKTFTEDFGRNTRAPTGSPVAAPSGYLIYNISADSASWTLRLNGLVQSVSAQIGVGFSATPVLGRGAAGYYLQGDIIEVIAYDRVLDGGERSVLGAYLSAKIGNYALSAPKLALVAASPTAVALSWVTGSVSTATIERKLGNSSFLPISSVTGATAYNDTGLVSGETYSYRVKLANSDGISDYSSVETITLVSQLPIPTTGLRLWLSADAGISVDSGGAVFGWADQSGRHKDAAQANSPAKPALVANASNGKPVVRFDGLASYFELPPVMTGTAEGELFVVMKLPEVATRDDGLWRLGGTDGSKTGFQGSARGLIDDFGRASPAALGSPVKPLSDYVIYNVSARAGEWQARLNGVMQYTDANQQVQFAAVPALGRSAGMFMRGDIAEVVVHGRVLSASERQITKKYLAQKYSINLNLPGSPTDTDGDGIPDAWELLNGTDPTYNDADDDPDDDGFSNIEEYRQGSSANRVTAPDTFKQIGLQVIWP